MVKLFKLLPDKYYNTFQCYKKGDIALEEVKDLWFIKKNLGKKFFKLREKTDEYYQITYNKHIDDAWLNHHLKRKLLYHERAVDYTKQESKSTHSKNKETRRDQSQGSLF